MYRALHRRPGRERHLWVAGSNGQPGRRTHALRALVRQRLQRHEPRDRSGRASAGCPSHAAPPGRFHTRSGPPGALWPRPRLQRDGACAGVCTGWTRQCLRRSDATCDLPLHRAAQVARCARCSGIPRLPANALICRRSVAPMRASCQALLLLAQVNDAEESPARVGEHDEVRIVRVLPLDALGTK